MNLLQKRWAESRLYKPLPRNTNYSDVRHRNEVVDYKEDSVGCGVYFILRFPDGAYVEVYREYPIELRDKRTYKPTGTYGTGVARAKNYGSGVKEGRTPFKLEMGD